MDEEDACAVEAMITTNDVSCTTPAANPNVPYAWSSSSVRDPPLMSAPLSNF